MNRSTNEIINNYNLLTFALLSRDLMGDVNINVKLATLYSHTDVGIAAVQAWCFACVLYNYMCLPA